MTRRPGGVTLALFLATMLGACATTGSKSYPYFDRLAIDALPPESAEEGDAVASPGKLILAGAAAGGMGAFVTGLAASLVCGPYFAVCFAGTGAAALGGATVGAVMAGSTALSAEETESVVAFLDDLQDAHNLGDELVAALSAQLPAARLAGGEAADARLGVEPQRLRVATGFDDTVVLLVAVNARLQIEPESTKPRQIARSFSCQTEPMPLADWLSTDKSSVEQDLSLCIEDLAVQISTALQAPSTDSITESSSLVGFGNYDPATVEW